MNGEGREVELGTAYTCTITLYCIISMKIWLYMLLLYSY